MNTMKKNSITMKTGKYIFISFLAAALTISSCQEIIDLEPYNQISETTVFPTPT